jgi:hypothetical protein
MIKQEHTYVTGDFPDIGPDPLNTTDYRGSERNQPHEYNGATRYARSTIPQYYYTDELPQGKDNITRFKPEPPNGPAWQHPWKAMNDTKPQTIFFHFMFLIHVFQQLKRILK